MSTTVDDRAHLHAIVPYAEKKRLAVLAIDQRRPMVEVILDAIREYLDRHEVPVKETVRRSK